MSVEDAQTTRHAGERKSLWGYLGVHTPIRGAFHDNFPGFSGFGFRRKLASTKTQQGTDKASEHNGHTVFSRAWVFCTHQQEGCQLVLFYHFSSSSKFAPASLFSLFRRARY